MKFNAVVGNPPYEKSIYLDFYQLAIERLLPNAFLSFITPAAFLSSVRKPAVAVRKLFSVGYCQSIVFHKIGTFTTTTDCGKPKPVLVVTCSVLFVNSPSELETVFQRPIGLARFEWTAAVTESPAVLCYDDMGASIWEVSSRYPRKFDLSQNSSRGVKARGPNVNHIMKLHLNYIDGNVNILRNIAGRMLPGIKLDEAGTFEYPAEIKSTRYIYNVETKAQARFLYGWMKSKLFGILLSMTGTTSSITSATLGSIPFIVLDEEYSDSRVYEILGLSAPQIKWIEEFGSDV